MTATGTTPSESSAAAIRSVDRRDRVDQIDGDRIRRFDLVERCLHWTIAVLVSILLFTGSTLYIGALSTLIGRRLLVKDIHVWSGLLLPVPWLLTLPGAHGRALRRDLARLGRWYRDDTAWVRSRGRAGAARMRKFNAGQKLFALVVAAALPVQLGTGLIMRWFEPFPDSIRTGATFVHDWTYVVLAVLVAGHILKALAEREALRSMWTGWVPASWARLHRPGWWAESGGDDAGGGPSR